MPTQLAIQPGTLYPQPGHTVEVNEEGKWTGTMIFLCHRDSVIALMPRPGTPHPDVPFMGAVGSAAQYNEGDLAEITTQYAGAEDTFEFDDNEKANAVYSMGLSVSEEPLLTHQRYKDLSADEKKALSGIISGKDKDDQGKMLSNEIASELGLELLAKIERGQTSYYSPRTTWKESWVRNSPVKTAQLNNVGKIDVPDGPVPVLGGGRNWLSNGVTQTQDGKSFRIEAEWLMSDRGGWDPEIYAA